MSAHTGSDAVTHPPVCALCDGPCKNPWHLPPVHANYPFLTPAQIAATQPKPEPPPIPPAGRAKRTENRPARTENRQ